MNWRIEISDTAAIERENLFLRLAAKDPDVAARWLEGLIRVVAALVEFPGPRAQPIARESERYGVEVRRLLYYGPAKRCRAGSAYRVLFYVIEFSADDEPGIIRILHFYHGAQDTEAPTPDGEGASA